SIVFTNGCFDILHYGHVKYLQEAKNTGNILVVAVNSDSSVKKLKGPSRPIVGQKNRTRVLSALESVDFVTIFSEDTPLKLIKLLKPDILVKGGDWDKKSIVGGRLVQSWGGKVISLPYVKGQSTTNIIDKIGKTKL
ncbi:MAG: D-glycero-beta-D-manno-heptose 1-phosphate adenylyltransferase, partial [Candidatus Omnitrophica bacterium]|nr:D-glycero-beta-D-manno-heptose 1-phosphate adenylyltransferase [Candidatus Omnitrophota bacterium]MDD5655319.1 D-glycero-beta-D-manno-heptose 1-phosphate adenylyltransferase [Candidatus Omnitrophota bacterium]